jgi:hypothetical protein
MINEISELTREPVVLEFSGVERVQIYSTFLHWFAAVNKKPVPDLERRVAEFKQRLSQLSRVIKFSYKFQLGCKDSDLIAEADGLAGQTLQQMKSGTLWFDAWPYLEYEVMAAVSDSPGTLPKKYKTLSSTIANPQ